MPAWWSIRLFAAAVVLFVPAASPAADEFDDGVRAYEARDFARARAVFLDLAELGDGASQYNLAAMALKGQGVTRDRGEAAGWMRAARENGYDPTPRALERLLSELAPAEREASERIVARFGRAALERSVLPPKDPSPAMSVPVSIEGPRLGDLGPAAPATVILSVVLGAGGRPRDPEIVTAAGRGRGDSAARSFALVAASRVLEARYEPARLDGAPVAVNFHYRISVRPPYGPEPQDRAYHAMASLGWSGGAAALLPGGRLLETAQGGRTEAQLAMGAQLLRAGEASKAVPWLERASRAGLAHAHVRLGLALLELDDTPLERVRELLSRAGSDRDRWGARHAIEVLACPNRRALHDPQLALAIAEEARLRKDLDPLSHAALAAAHASAGERVAAERAQQDAIDRAKRLGWRVEGLEERHAAYAAGRPCESPFLPRAQYPVVLPRPPVTR